MLYEEDDDIEMTPVDEETWGKFIAYWETSLEEVKPPEKVEQKDYKAVTKQIESVISAADLENPVNVTPACRSKLTMFAGVN